tara:strand:- start:1688 stop:1897 length:210 start_codon:yes stop_codon:yes gene_type:complete
LKLLFTRTDSKQIEIKKNDKDLVEINPQESDLTIGRIKQLKPTMVKTEPILSIWMGSLFSSGGSLVDKQ